MIIDTKYHKLFSDIFEASHISFINCKDIEKSKGIITTYPQEWLNHYLGQRYHNYDPAITRNPLPFTLISWGEGVFKKACPIGKRLYSEARSYGLTSGISFSFQKADGHSNILSVCSSESEQNYKRFIQSKKHHVLPTMFMAHTFFELLQSQASEEVLINQLMQIIKESAISRKREKHELAETVKYTKAFCSKVNFLVNASDREKLKPISEIIVGALDKLV